MPRSVDRLIAVGFQLPFLHAPYLHYRSRTLYILAFRSKRYSITFCARRLYQKQLDVRQKLGRLRNNKLR